MAAPNFTLPKKHTFSWNITVWVPIDCKKVATKFKAEFLHTSPERRLEILDTFREIQKDRNQQMLSSLDAEQPDEEDLEFENHTSFEEDLLSEVLVGWDGLLDHDGDPLEFSEENRRSVLAFDPARAALIKGYYRALNGQAPEKNSSRRRKPGQKA